MAMHLGDGDDMGPQSDINVTPFIDVVLVLLIIFMIAAPLSTVNVPVDLPSSNASPQEAPEIPVEISLTGELDVYLGEQRVLREELGAGIRALVTAADQRLYLRADREVGYGDVMDLMNLLRGEGFSSIALVGQEGGR